jgi:CheY-like chemotaxis protein
MSFLYVEEKRILLIDADVRTRNLRATVLRNREFNVHTAASLPEAIPLWKVLPYDLILVAGSQQMECEELITQIRHDKPSQRIGLLVGPPSYIREVQRISSRTKSAVKRRPGSTKSLPLDNPAVTQWQRTIYNVVSDWYKAQAARLRLPEHTEPVTSAL